MTTMEEILWDAQLKAYPDSIRLSDDEVRQALYSTPEYLRDMVEDEWHHKDGYDNAMERRLAFSAYKEKTILQEQLHWARSAFMCRYSYPEGLFYACCKKDDGSYRYVGFRYGTEMQQYISGFVGLIYIPQD